MYTYSHMICVPLLVETIEVPVTVIAVVARVEIEISTYLRNRYLQQPG